MNPRGTSVREDAESRGARISTTPVGAARAVPWQLPQYLWVLLGSFAAVLCAALPESGFTLLVTCLLALIASAAGRATALFIILGASTSIGLSFAIGSIPNALTILCAVFLGSLFRRVRYQQSVLEQRVAVLLVLTILLVLLLSLRLPTTTAGLIAGYSAIVLPLALGVTLNISQRSHGESPVMGLTLGLAIVIGAGLNQARTRILETGYEQYGEYRVFESSIGSSNYAAALAATTGVLILTVALASTRGPLVRVALAAIAMPFLAAPVLLLSRGATVSACVVAAVLVGRYSRTSKTARVGLILLPCAVLIAMVGTGFGSRWSNTVQSGDFTSGRVDLYTETLNQLELNPLLGTGLGRLTDHLYVLMGVAYPHNIVLDVLGQMGLVVGAAYLLLVIVPHPMGRWTLASAAILFMLLDSLVEPLIDTPQGALMFGLLCGAHALHVRPGCFGDRDLLRLPRGGR